MKIIRLILSVLIGLSIGACTERNGSRFQIEGDPNGNRVRIIGGEVRLLGYETRKDGNPELKTYNPNDEIGFDEEEWYDFYQHDIFANLREWRYAVIGIRFQLEYYKGNASGKNSCPGCDGPADKIENMHFMWVSPDTSFTDNVTDYVHSNQDENVFFIPDHLLNSNDFDPSKEVPGAYEYYNYNYPGEFMRKYNKRSGQIKKGKLGQEFYFFIWTHWVDEKLKESGVINLYVDFGDRIVKLNGVR